MSSCFSYGATSLEQCFSYVVNDSDAIRPVLEAAKKMHDGGTGDLQQSFPVAGTIIATLCTLVWLYRTAGHVAFRKNAAMLMRLKGQELPTTARRLVSNPTTQLFSFLFFTFRVLAFIIVLLPPTDVASPYLRALFTAPSRYTVEQFSDGVSRNSAQNWPEGTTFSTVSRGGQTFTYAVRDPSQIRNMQERLGSSGASRSTPRCCSFGRQFNFSQLHNNNLSSSSIQESFNSFNITQQVEDDVFNGQNVLSDVGLFFSYTNGLNSARVNTAVALAFSLFQALVEALLLLYWSRLPSELDGQRKREVLRGMYTTISGLVDFLDQGPPGKPKLLWDRTSRPALVLSIGLVTLQGFAVGCVVLSAYSGGTYFFHPVWILILCTTAHDMCRFAGRFFLPLGDAEPTRFTTYDRYLEVLDEERELELTQERLRARESLMSNTLQRGDTNGGNGGGKDMQQQQQREVDNTSLMSSASAGVDDDNGVREHQERKDPRRKKLRCLEDLHLELEQRPRSEVIVPIVLMCSGLVSWLVAYYLLPLPWASPAHCLALFLVPLPLASLLYIRNEVQLRLDDGNAALSLFVIRRTALGAFFQVDITAAAVRDDVSLLFDNSSGSGNEAELIVDQRLVYKLALSSCVDQQSERERHKAVMARLIRTVRDSRRGLFRRRVKLYDDGPRKMSAAVPPPSSASAAAEEEESVFELDDDQRELDHREPRQRAHSKMRRMRMEKPRADNTELARLALLAGRLSRNGPAARDMLQLSIELDSKNEELPQELLSRQHEIDDFLFFPTNTSHRAVLYFLILAIKFLFSLLQDFAAADPSPFCAPQLEVVSRLLELLLLLFLWELRKKDARPRLEPSLFALLQRATCVVSLLSTVLSMSAGVNEAYQENNMGFSVTIFCFSIIMTFLLFFMPISY